MQERELKLYIPSSQQAAVIEALQLIQNRPSMRLAAQYFDTAKRDLARQGAALRLRLEDNQWVQTLKMRGDDELSHLEYNHPRPNAILDLSLYDDTPAAVLFKDIANDLGIRYQTEVQRTTAVLQQGDADKSTEIELALDLGVIKAKDSELPISEIEFELKKGQLEEVFNLALRWLQRFELIIELRTKSERGDALYEYAVAHTVSCKGAAAALAIAQQPYRIPPNTAPFTPELKEAYLKGSSAFLSQVIRNAAFIAGIDEIKAPENLQASYLMLMRVGMRRLRSCRQLFKPWLTASELHLAKSLQKYYKHFGLWRDKDMLWLELQPKLIAAGLPAAKKLNVPKKEQASPKTCAGSAEYQSLLLCSLANLVLKNALAENTTDTVSAQKQLETRLEKWLDRIKKRGSIFKELTPSAQHSLRNQIKRLRYNLEILGYATDDPLYLILSKAQHQLGHLCDAYVAHDWYERHATNQAQKQFAYTWLEEKIQKSKVKSAKTLILLQQQNLRTGPYAKDD